MANIQPVSIWYQGHTRSANVFNLYSDGDNLVNTASFQYQLIELIIISPEEQMSQTLIIGQLSITGQDYIDWDSSTSANDWIYNWAAQKLNLVLIP
jgi:hypothetical protein